MVVSGDRYGCCWWLLAFGGDSTCITSISFFCSIDGDWSAEHFKEIGVESYVMLMMIRDDESDDGGGGYLFD